MLKNRLLESDNEELVHVVVLEEATWGLLADSEVSIDVPQNLFVVAQVVGRAEPSDLIAEPQVYPAGRGLVDLCLPNDVPDLKSLRGVCGKSKNTSITNSIHDDAIMYTLHTSGASKSEPFKD